jgi:hypothetical protein
VGRSYKIDIVATPFSQMDHHGCHLFGRHLVPFGQMAYIVILAKAAKQIARGHKDGP